MSNKKKYICIVSPKGIYHKHLREFHLLLAIFTKIDVNLPAYENKWHGRFCGFGWSFVWLLLGYFAEVNKWAIV